MTKCPHCGYKGGAGITTLAYFETGPDKNWKYCPKCKKRIDNVSDEFRSESLEKQNASIEEFNERSDRMVWLGEIARDLSRFLQALPRNDAHLELHKVLRKVRSETRRGVGMLQTDLLNYQKSLK